MVPTWDVGAKRAVVKGHVTRCKKEPCCVKLGTDLMYLTVGEIDSDPKCDKGHDSVDETPLIRCLANTTTRPLIFQFV